MKSSQTSARSSAGAHCCSDRLFYIHKDQENIDKCLKHPAKSDYHPLLKVFRLETSLSSMCGGGGGCGGDEEGFELVVSMNPTPSFLLSPQLCLYTSLPSLTPQPLQNHQHRSPIMRMILLYSTGIHTHTYFREDLLVFPGQ